MKLKLIDIIKEHHGDDFPKGLLKKSFNSFLNKLQKASKKDYDKVEDIVKKHFSVKEQIDFDEMLTLRDIKRELEDEIKEHKKAHKLEYNNLLTFHKFEIDELRKKLEESDKHNQWLEEELEILETGKTREELFG